jgi:ATP-dependent Clp protease protease subunit
MENYMKLDYYSEFKNYASKHIGITDMQFYQWEKLQNSIYTNVNVTGPIAPKGSMTPYILEEREMRVTQMDIFSRMLLDRILWAVGPVNDQMSTVVCAQLMFLNQIDSKTDIKLYCDSPGGSVKSGLSMVDVMNYIEADVQTVNIGMAASMGSILLGNGTKGKRFALPHSRVMLHQVSSGGSGTIQDLRISMQETEKYNQILFKMLGEFCGKDPEQVKKDADRDLWLSSEEALDYGIIDGIVEK